MPPSWFLLGFFLLYMAAMILIGWRVSRGQRGGEDFLLGSRGLPFLLLFATTVATMVGTGSSMGAVGFAYSNGWAGSLYGIGGGLGMALLVLLFAEARRHRFMTMSEEISYYYGANRTIKGAVAVLMYAAEIGWLGVHILGGSMYLAWITGIDLKSAAVLTALGFGIYTLIGGYLAVVWSDAVQAVILFLGFTLMAVLAVPAAGGFGAMAAASPAGFSFLGLQAVGALPALSLVLVIAVGVLATPAYRHRIYSGKDERTVRWSLGVSAVLFTMFAALPPIIGLAAYTLNPDLQNSNFAFPFMATEVLPLWLGSLILVAGLSATLSSGDSDAIAGVTILLRDIYVIVTGRMPPRERMIRYSRIALLFTIGVAFSLALFSTNIIDYITRLVATVQSGLLVCAVLGKFWSRATWQGGLAAMAGGSAGSFLVMLQPQWLAYWGNPIIPALAAALLCGVAVSLLTPCRRLTPAEALRILEEERRQIEAFPAQATVRQDGEKAGLPVDSWAVQRLPRASATTSA